MRRPARGPVVLLTAVAMVLAAFATLPAPARALSGEMTIKAPQAFTITYDDTKDTAVLWWDWEVVGGNTSLTFRVWRGTYWDYTVSQASPERMLHDETSMGSSGSVDLRNDRHTVAVWSHNTTGNVTFRYHAWLNPPDMTLVNSALAALFLAPVVGILVLLGRDRLRKRETDSGRAS